MRISKIRNLKLTNRESKYLKIVFDCFINNKKVTWKKLNKAIGRKGVHDVTKKFRKFGIINEDDYEINKGNLNEIKQIIHRYVDAKKSIIPSFEAFLSFVSEYTFLIICIILTISTIFLMIEFPFPSFGIKEDISAIVSEGEILKLSSINYTEFNHTTIRFDSGDTNATKTYECDNKTLFDKEGDYNKTFEYINLD